jgi:hypothetical protein
MTNLADVLELMHTARRRYHAVEARIAYREEPSGADRVEEGELRVMGSTADRVVGGLRPDIELVHWRQCMFDPNVTIPELWLEPIDEVAVAGRRGVRLHARRRPTTHDYYVLPRITEDYELVVDAERGILLRLECIRDGRVVLGLEVLEIEFDGGH